MGNVKQTHCKKGHELIDSNIVFHGIKRRCKICRDQYELEHADYLKEKRKQWAKDNPERMRELGNNWDKKNQAKRTLWKRERHPSYAGKLRMETFTAYGNGKPECVCCGETILVFLTIDHINGRTEHDKNNQHRRGWMGYQYLRARDFPPGYQTLCWNCNSGRQLNNGVCPHKEKSSSTQSI